jgi:multisubunit Na+/H+ antiporter MnhG subunit
MSLAQPTATHAISRAAFRCGVQPWRKEKRKNDDTSL